MSITALITPSIKQQIDVLYQSYLTLNEQERTVLTVLAVVYKPIGMIKLDAIINLLCEQGLLLGKKQEYRLLLPGKEQLLSLSILISSREGLQVNSLLVNKLTENIDQLMSSTALLSHEKLLKIIIAAEDVVPVLKSHSWQNQFVDKRRVIRDLYLLNQLEQFEQALAFNKNPQVIDHVVNQILIELLFLPFDINIFTRLPNSVQYQAFASLIRAHQSQGNNCQYAIELLEQVCAIQSDNTHPDYNADCYHLLAEQYLYQCRFADFERIQAEHDTSSYGLQLWGAHSFLLGKNQQAISYFEKAIIAKNKLAKRKNQYLHEILGYFYKLALIAAANDGDTGKFSVALQQIDYEENDRKVNSDFYHLGLSLVKVIQSLQTGLIYTSPIEYNCIDEHTDYFSHQLNYLHYLLAHLWCNQAKDLNFEKQAKKYQSNFELLAYPLFATICQQLAMSFANKTVSKSTKLLDFTRLIQSKAKWDLALDKLIALNPNAQTNSQSEKEVPVKETRLVWELNLSYEHSLQAREQKLNKSGWTKGRPVSLKRLKREQQSFSYLSESDKKICAAIEAHQGWGYYAKTEYSLAGLRALNAAVGIDNLYHATHSISLQKQEPELVVTQVGEQLCLSIADLPDHIHENRAQAAYALKPLTDSEYQLTVFSPEHIKVAEIIGEGGLLIPLSAKQKALDGISAIAPFLNIQSDMAELDTGLESYECNPNLVVNIEPIRNGLTFTCMVMPFGENGPAYVPGVGNANLSHEIKGKRLATQRDLLNEEALLDHLDEVCPVFFNMSGNILVLDDLQDALSALEALEAASKQADFDLTLRWPKGKKVSLSKPLEGQHLQLSLSKNNEWFDITGNLQVDNEQVIELQKLLTLVSTSNGRFIELGANQILALSSDLRQKLEHINQVTDQGQFHPLASLQMEEATSGMRMKTIHAWDEQTKKMHQANTIEPKLPDTFQAQLRDYQVLGFDWASRLAHWGAGACLADDMGLGKTLQALAVLLSRASKGPALIIAPTSVCFNWQQEALKFTPTLNIKMFADAPSTKRLSLLSHLAAFDVVIISYGLLQRETDLLKNVHWQTIVADEAQALKNPLAKRTKAAFALKANFKMITTGTPIENDLSELWSLFRFINPGLLGNIKRFTQRFSQPIENAKEDKLAARKASQGLKALIQPFILRRLKSQVLTELPSRTNINIQVELSAKEQAFYEALRLSAIDNISQAGTQANAGEQRIKMLAELVKLRQACCHTKLVMAESDIPSAKLAALDELLSDLKLNNHKALLFSQFVGHLQLIKTHIENKGFSYQYLDGSTPQKERQKRVNAFQAGQGDIFLISLKAGGSGLNLTAADYVIHMDPWWNPAVEEQASDRAHRMGQTRPVTIYRLITQNTIEEKIVALHQQKRDLADNLLSGNEVASKLSVNDMLNLLKDTF